MHSDNSIKLSIILPVRNEGRALKIMGQVIEATVEVPHEIIVVYDFPEDDSVPAARWLQGKYSNVHLVFNDIGPGVVNAVRKGVSFAKGDIILISPVDEVFPIAAIEDMLELMNRGCEFVSCTRYALGGKRLGGSLIGGLLSRLANLLFRMFTGSVLTDATTGIKMMKKSFFGRVTLESRLVGWSFAFEMSIKAQFLGIRVGEVPVVSVDRPFGGQSSFKLGSWVKEYLRWFFWGWRYLKKTDRVKNRPMRLERYSGK